MTSHQLGNRPQEGPEETAFSVGNDKLILRLEREKAKNLNSFVELVHQKMSGDVLPRLAHLGASQVSEWLNNGRRPFDWIASAHAVREIARESQHQFRLEDLSSAVEPVVFRDTLARYFTTNPQERSRFAPQLETLSFLVARNLQLSDTQLNSTHPSMMLLAVISVFVDDAVTSSSYAISSHPVRDLLQSLESIAVLNPQLAPAISWFVSSWGDLISVGRDLLAKRALTTLAEEVGFQAYSEDQLAREMHHGFQTAVELLRIELDLREVLSCEARRAPTLWSQPATYLADRFGMWEEKAIILDDRSAIAQSSRAPASLENISKFRTHCLQELKRIGGYNTWIIADAVDQWSAILEAGRVAQERELPTLLVVLETLDQMIEKKFHPDGIRELLKALRMPDSVCNEHTAPMLDGWCSVLQEGAAGQVRLRLFGLQFSPLSDPHSKDAFFSYLRKQRSSDERIVLVGRDLLDKRIAESLGFEPSSIALLTGATAHNCVTEVDRQDMMLYCLNEVMFNPELPPIGPYQSVGLQISGNDSFTEQVNRVAPLSEPMMRKEWFGGTHDYLVIAGGKRDRNYGLERNPGERSRLLI